MGFKEKMMDMMMGKMSAEEKKEMMDSMMGKFFNDMKSDEKQSMMNDMMGKFMGSMSSEEKQSMMKEMMPKMMGGGNFPMMDMMKNMMSGMMGGMGKDKNENKDSGGMGFNPMEMCQKMMSNIGKSSELATYATPEVRALFEEWADQIENEIMDFIKTNNSTDPDKLAENFKLSKDSVSFFLNKLSQKGKIKIKAEAEI